MSAHTRQGKRAWLGGGIIVLLAAFATGIFLLDDLVALLHSSYDVVAVFPEAPRLARGSPVWVGGNEVGAVHSVALLPAQADTQAAVALVLRLPGRVREQVRRDSRVRITAVNLLGVPAVDIVPGSPRAAVLRPGDTLHARRGAGATALLARAASLRAATDTALLEMRALQPRVARRAAALQRVNAQLAAAQAEYQRLLRDLRASPLVAGARSGELAAALARGRARLAALASVLGGVQEEARASGFNANTAAFAARAQALQNALAGLQDSMRLHGGTLDRLARDSALVHALAGARAELDSLLADARRNPWRYVF